MTSQETDVAIRLAEIEIGQILKSLELQTNKFVEEVNLLTERIGTQANGHHECSRHVVLSMCHPPGSNWQ